MATAVIAAAQWIGMAVFEAASAAGATITTAATLANVAVAATAVAAVAGAVELSKALQPKVGGDFGTQIDFKADPQAGIPYVIGRTGTGGNIVFADTSGAKNIYLTYGVVLSGAGPIEGFESFLVNDTPVTFGADAGEGASGYFQNRMWQVRQLGATPEPSYLHWTATGTKDTPADHAGLPATWSSDHKMSGFAGFLWGLQYNTDVYSGGVPKPLSVLKGVKVYDPRKDSTYPGGSGSHRPGVETTYEYSENPYLHGLTWCIGRIQNGLRILGVGAALVSIDTAAFVEGANVADANGWKAGGVVYSTDDKYEVLKACLQAGAGKPMRLGAKISCLVNTPRVSLATLTGADVVGKVSVSGTITRRARLNTIWPQYRDENQGWQMVTADEPVTISDYYAADKGMRSKTIEYSLVQYVDHAAQLARYDIEDSREFTPVTLPCKPRWLGFHPGDCITVTEPEFLLNGQKLLILQRRVDPSSMTVTFTCRSETDGKHAFALGQTGVAPTTPGLTGGDPNFVPTPELGDWSAEGGTLDSADGTKTPSIVFTGSSDAGLVSSVIVEWRVVLDLAAGQYGDWVGIENPASATRIEARGLLPGQQYHCRARYKTVRQVENAALALDLGLVTTGSWTFGGVTNIGGKTPAQIAQELAAAAATGSALTQTALEQAAGLIQEFEGRVADTFHQGEKVKRIVVDETDTFEDDKYSLLKRLQLLGFVTDDGSAFQFNLTTVKVSDTESFADYQEGVTSRFEDNEASIVLEQTTRADAVSAEADARIALGVTVGNNLAAAVSDLHTWVNNDSAGAEWISSLEVSFGGNFHGQIVNIASVTSDLGASWTLALDVNGHVSGITSHNSGTTSDMVFTATEIGFSNGGSIVYPLSVAGGVVKATNFEADRVKANSIVTGSLVGGAVTDCTWDEQTPSLTLTSSSQQVFSTPHTTTVSGAPHAIFINLICGNPGADVGVLLRIRRDGSEIAQRAFFARAAFGATGSFMVFDQPGSGSHTYSFTAETTPGSGSSGQAQISNMLIMELKR